MWIFTRDGFFSVVLARKIKDNIPTQEVDPDTVMVRARCYQHLENLKQNYNDLTNTDIQETANTDYRYRIIVPKAVWSSILETMCQELDYTNFKSTCARSPLTDQSYDELLHEVWHKHYELQDQEDGRSDRVEESTS